MADAGGGAIFTSRDGITWRRQRHPATWWPWAIAAGSRGVVMVGYIGETAASWSSRDGRDWTVTKLPKGIGDDVTATDRGWLSVGGQIDYPCASWCPSIRALAWTSPNGRRWTAVPRQASMSKAGFETAAAVGDGFIAGGAKGMRAALWSSPTGVIWTRIPGATFGSRLGDGHIVSVTGIAAGHRVVVAVGMDAGQYDGMARAWWSADGRTWKASKVEKARGGQLFSVTVTERGFLAVGPSSGCRGGIWESASGRSWTCIGMAKRLAGFGPSAAASSGTVEVVVGLTDAGWSEDSPDGMPGAIFWRPLR